MCVTSVGLLYDRFFSIVNNGWKSYGYVVALCFLFFGMLSLRIPYVFGGWGFTLFVVFVVAPLFSSVLLVRLADFNEFLISFLPVGCPLYLAPFVFLLELFSFFFVRFIVLLFRPIINMFLGHYAIGLACNLMCTGHVCVGFFFFFLVVCYELFVTLIHWYIVDQILFFSQDS
uniref:ATPase subunit 6 n=1 Tax=Eurytrema pancreaticum TaxID=374591 RepID=A0A0E3Y6U9_EUTPN|nr:ATPase subunit 6 [Eurytrema pancreaticum]